MVKINRLATVVFFEILAGQASIAAIGDKAPAPWNTMVCEVSEWLMMMSEGSREQDCLLEVGLMDRCP